MRDAFIHVISIIDHRIENYKRTRQHDTLRMAEVVG